jgi:hypothetical protein
MKFLDIENDIMCVAINDETVDFMPLLRIINDIFDICNNFLCINEWVLSMR